MPKTPPAATTPARFMMLFALENLQRLALPPEQFPAAGITGLAVYPFGFYPTELRDDKKLLTPAWVDQRLDLVRQLVGKLPTWLLLSLSHQGNGFPDEIIYPWQSPGWAVLYANLTLIASRMAAHGFTDLFLDDEGYGINLGHQDPALCWRAPGKGEQGLPKIRGAELARALLKGDPSRKYGTLGAVWEERDCPGWQPFMRGFYSVLGKQGSRIDTGTYGLTVGNNVAKTEAGTRQLTQCQGLIYPALQGPNTLIITPAETEAACQRLATALPVALKSAPGGQIMLYCDVQQGDHPGTLFGEPDPRRNRWASAIKQAAGVTP